MNIQQPTNGRYPSNNLSCSYCHTHLQPQAIFCSSCGERVKKIGDWEIRTEDGEDNAQEQEVDTVRMASLSQIHLKRWQLSQSLKNVMAPEQPHVNSPLPQDAEAPMSLPLETGIPRTDLANTRAQHEASIPIEPSQSLPTTPASSIPETWQEIPETEVPASKRSGSNLSWPIIIILSALAAGLVNFVFTDTMIRPVIVFWFLFVCPGMVLVRFLHLKEPVAEWTLAFALSFAIDAIVAGIQLYAGKWSPSGTLNILIGLSLGCAIVQLATIGSTTTYISKLSHIVRSRKLRVLLAIFLALLTGLDVVAGFLSHVPNHSATPISTVTPSPSRPTPAPTSAPTIYPLIAGTYNGTIDDLSLNVSTSLSLTGVRQSQGKISGYLILGSRLQGSGPFSGTIDTAKHLQFTVTDAAGHATFFFEGVMQSAISLSGDYYQCSPNTTQNSQCSRASGGYGIWSAILAS